MIQSACMKFIIRVNYIGMTWLLPGKAGSLLEKSERPIKFVLFRLPKDLDLEELNGSEIDLTDLKISSISGELAAIPDLMTNPDRASACPLFSEGEESMKCGRCFDATIQIIKRKIESSNDAEIPHSASTDRKDESFKKAKKSKKIKIQDDATQE